MKEKMPIRPAAAAFLLMMAMAITTSALSFFVSPVCADLGLGRGSFTVYYSLMTAAGAFSTSFLGSYMNKRGVRSIVLVSGIWVCCGLNLFSMVDQLWLFYLVGGAMGFFGTSCVNLCANVAVQQSYSSAQASGVMGVVMAGSGVGGMIFSVVVPNVIEGFGWRLGYRFLGVCWLVLAMSAFLILGKRDNSGSGSGRKAIAMEGMTRAEALRSPKLYLLMVTIMILAACCGIQQQLPSLLEDMEFSTAQVSLMISVMTAGLAVGKIFQGILSSKIGIVKGVYVMVVLFALGFLMMLSPALVYPGLVALAFGMGVVTTLLPIVSRFVFGSRDYASIWSMLATASSVGSFIASPVWGMVYDMFGSYTPGLIAAPVLLAGALVVLMRVFREKR